jgi:6-pyruvoyltetrahydropterin/6-carboxytetrahydropterin synthase
MKVRKLDKSEKIRNMYTSIRYRMVSISLSVVVFIVVVVAALSFELYENQESYVEMYESQQQLFVDQLGKRFLQMYEDGKGDTQVIDCLTHEVEASGSRFYVFTKDEEVLFAKNDITTNTLGSLKDKSAFFQSISSERISVLRSSFEAAGSSYEIAVVSDLYSVKTEGQLVKHEYYVLMAVAVMSLVLVSLMVTLVGTWNRTEKQLEGTQRELDLRNEKMEQISNEIGGFTGDRTDMLAQEEKTGVTMPKKSEGVRYQQYKFKFYLNARHAIYINGKLGEIHPHTWEMILHVVKGKDQFIQFNALEKRVEEFMEPYQNQLLNQVQPFDSINPTLENCAHYFKDRLLEILNKDGWIFLMMEMSESPARSYVINMVEE